MERKSPAKFTQKLKKPTGIPLPEKVGDEKNLKRKQQQLSRKQKGSNSLNKAGTKKVARVYGKITNCREDFIHKRSRRRVGENQVIVTENLNVKDMMKNHCLADLEKVVWGMFMTMLKYAENDG
ncbi:transposase [Limnospira indica]|uniref:transposase n=1 Tax=Limnospira indica TaxID=147322 RepID=UPI0018613B78|nr:transposase [Limnospira indica]QNH59526.1 MAG: transposase [Limnospira indica BM01]